MLPGPTIRAQSLGTTWWKESTNSYMFSELHVHTVACVSCYTSKSLGVINIYRKELAPHTAV